MQNEDERLSEAYRNGLIEGRKQRDDELSHDVYKLRRMVVILYDYLYDVLPDEVALALASEFKELK